MKRHKDNLVSENKTKRRKIEDLRSHERSVIGSKKHRTILPLPPAVKKTNREYFINDTCRNCEFKYISRPAKRNHINIYRNKSDVVHIPESSFDVYKHMLIICMSPLCCKSFANKSAFYNHIKLEHNQLPTDTLPIYQDPGINTFSAEFSCQMCRGEFTNKANKKNMKKRATEFNYFSVMFVIIQTQILATL